VGRAQADGRWVVDAGALFGVLFFGLRDSRFGLSLGTGASSGSLLMRAGESEDQFIGRPPAEGGCRDGQPPGR
jgi:hypothetical protein